MRAAAITGLKQAKTLALDSNGNPHMSLIGIKPNSTAAEEGLEGAYDYTASVIYATIAEAILISSAFILMIVIATSAVLVVIVVLLLFYRRKRKIVSLSKSNFLLLPKTE